MTGKEGAIKGQHHKRLAWIVAAGLAIAAVFGFGAFDPHRLDLWHRLTGPEVDGRWIVETIDGRPAPARLELGIRWGEVRGGYDGCNHWGFEQEDRGPGTERMMVSTLQACPEIPGTEGYGAVAMLPATMSLMGDGRLRMTALDYTVELRRADDTESTH